MTAVMVNAFDPAATGALERPERDLVARRVAALGPAYRLFYDRPVHPVAGEGVWLATADGERLLDAYNNVVSVGHCHPRVVAAIAGQAATLNTHTRYLHGLVVAYAERLLATLPPGMRAMFTCTGSEANDLALRIARVASGGRGVVVTTNAYHGVTELLAGMSPSLGPGSPLHGHVRAVAPPEGAEDAAGFASRVAAAAAELAEAGHGPATLMLDTVLSSDGVRGAPAGVIGPAVDAIHAAGGLFLADEVQAGLGRVGEPFWGWAHHGLAPDLVTCGKPMGNGHPVAMAAARGDLADRFGATVRYFNTFGGNPVSAAAGLAVLDVLRDEDLPARAGRVGDALVAGLADLAARDGRLSDIRGVGLSIGADLPDGGTAARVVNGLRERGVLISATGPAGATLKIRPPLVFGPEHADLLLDRLAATLEAVP